MTTAETGAIEERSMGNVAHVTLRDAILQCELVPGAAITEARLAADYGLGRAAVRAALIRLMQERLVDVVPRRGYVVAPVTLKRVADLFGLRMILEPASAGLAAARSDDGLIAELERLNAACAPGEEGSDPAGQRRANRAFHLGVAAASDNDRLHETLAGLLDELARVLYLPQLATQFERVQTTPDEHARIIQAIRDRDVAGAEQAARDHVEPNMRSVIDALVRSPAIASVNLSSMVSQGASARF
ncbi:MAG TPA: GntR family transcriptional regulator [Thermomicrobiales bacterium]|nr:GntR family transcriptional regulator [Thermomicrobiales bacterium]